MSQTGSDTARGVKGNENFAYIRSEYAGRASKRVEASGTAAYNRGYGVEDLIWRVVAMELKSTRIDTQSGRVADCWISRGRSCHGDGNGYYNGRGRSGGRDRRDYHLSMERCQQRYFSTDTEVH